MLPWVFSDFWNFFFLARSNSLLYFRSLPISLNPFSLFPCLFCIIHIRFFSYLAIFKLSLNVTFSPSSCECALLFSYSFLFFPNLSPISPTLLQLNKAFIYSFSLRFFSCVSQLPVYCTENLQLLINKYFCRCTLYSRWGVFGSRNWMVGNGPGINSYIKFFEPYLPSTILSLAARYRFCYSVAASQ